MRTRYRKDLRKRLFEYKFTHFITLATNHMLLSDARMRSLLKEWDARVNRKLNGPRWTKRPDERLVWFAFPEKIDVNPHWHLIAQVDPWIESTGRQERTINLAILAEKIWLELLPRGSFDCIEIKDDRVIEYVTKNSNLEECLEKFVVYREFMNI